MFYKRFSEMSPEERGVIKLAHASGYTIEVNNNPGFEDWLPVEPDERPSFIGSLYYRVK